jgi:hypothetical protein
MDREARRIVQAVRDRYGVELPVVAGNRGLEKLTTQHVVTLGCLADNPFVEALYFHWNTLVDRWYPGSGGWVIQMIVSPDGRGQHVLLLGGSDAQGVNDATGRFVAQIETSHDGRIPWQLEVHLGDGHLPLPADRMDVLGTAASPILTPDSALPSTPYESGFEGGSARDHLLRLGMYGPHADNFYLSRSSQLGLRYLYTGSLEDAGRYRQTLLEEVGSGVVGKLYHYKSIRMFQLWALLGACPVFDDDERDQITGAIRTYLLEESGVVSVDAIRKASEGSEIFSRHVACDALNLWVGADWLWRLTGEARWLDDRSVADAYFEAQSDTDVPLTGLTEGYATYLEVILEWMLLSCPHRIADDAHIRVWAERVMGLCTNTGQLVLGPQTDASRYPYHLLRKLAYLLDDGRCLFVADLRERQVPRGMDRVVQFSAGQAYAGDIEARRPGDGVGMVLHPMNERLRRWKAPSIPRGKGFDRAVAREGWRAEDDYLMVIGVRSGAKSLPNVGTLAAYERFGQRLITSDSVPLFPASASPWRHSVVTVNAGGLGAGMVEGAQVLVQSEIAGGYLLSYRIEQVGRYRWVRLLYWKPSGYVLVVDRVVVVGEQESFTLGVNWRCGGQMEGVDGCLATLAFDSEAEGRFYVQVSEGLDLKPETNTYPALGAPPGSAPNREMMLHATMDRSTGLDGEVEVATLLHAVTGTRGPHYHLSGGEEGWIVEGPQETLGFGRGRGEGELEIRVRGRGNITASRGTAVIPAGLPRRGDGGRGLPTRWSFELPGQVSAWTQATDGSAVALGTEGGAVVVLDGDGTARWTAQCDATVTALTFLENDLIVGTRSGQVSRFDEEGAVKWRHHCIFRAERPFWPWWFLETPLVGALAVGRDPVGERDLLAVGTGSTSLNFLEASTGQLLKDVVSPYGLPDRIQAYLSASSGGLQFLVGHSWLSCGSSVRAWSPPPQAGEGVSYQRSVDPMGRTVDGWDCCGVVDFWVGPLIRGMPDRVVVLRHGAVNQITVYDEATGDPLWDAGLGGAPVALAVVGGGDSAATRICVAEQFGWFVEFDGNGRRVWATHVAGSLRGMNAIPDGDLVLWNREGLYIPGPDQDTDRYRLEGDPLGWYAHPQYAGLLCIEKEHLVLGCRD